MKISAVQVDGHLVRGPLKVIASQPVGADHLAVEAPSGLRSIIGGVTAGATANYSWQGFQATNTFTADEIAKLLVKNGLSREHAPNAAKAALEILRSEPTKVLLVAVSAGGTAWAALEASSKVFGLRLSAVRKLVVSILVATLVAVVYYLLRQRGYAQ